MNTFGERLKFLRNEKNITATKLANELNVSYASISLYEKNKRFPRRNTLKKISEFFNVSVDFLICNTNSREKETSLKEEVIKIIDLIDIDSLDLKENDRENFILETIEFINDLKFKYLSY